jgi:hypothetical protein
MDTTITFGPFGNVHGFVKGVHEEMDYKLKNNLCLNYKRNDDVVTHCTRPDEGEILCDVCLNLRKLWCYGNHVQK